jgi:DNA polymerase-3 subunit delta
MILLLSGANDFAIRQTLDTITEKFLNKHGVHALERIDGEALEPSRLPDLLQGTSLFAPERLVVVRSASKNKPLWEALGDWAGKIPAGVTLVLCESAPDKRTRTYKQLQKGGKFHDFPELNEIELGKWAVQTAKELGTTLEPKMAGYLVTQVGTDQWRLFTELQKLSYQPVITRELIDDLVEPNPQASAFELLDAVLGGKPARASELLHRLRTVEDPYKLFGLLVSQVQTLALVVSGRSKSAEAIASEAGVHPFVVRKMQPVARTIDIERVGVVTRAVAQTDTQMKSLGVDPWVLLEQCLLKISSAVR